MQHRKIATLRFLFLSLGFLLIGCNEDNSVATVRYLEALNERNLDTAQGLVCETYVDDVTMGLTTVDDPDEEAFEFRNVSCAPQGNDVMCRFVVEQLTQSADITGVERTREVVFNFEDGKVCGFEEQVVE